MVFFYYLSYTIKPLVSWFWEWKKKVTPNSATLVAPISSSFNSGQDSGLGYFLPVVSQAQGSHAVNEECCGVDVPAMLTGSVVVGEGVVVVVEALAWKRSTGSS